MPTPTFDLKRYLTKLAAGEPVAAPSGSGKQMFVVGNRMGARNSQVPTVTPPAESLSKSLPAPAVKPLTSPLAKAPPKTSFKLPRTKFPSPFKVAGFELNMPVAWKPPSIAAAERRRKKRQPGSSFLQPGQFLTSLGLTAGLGGLGAYGAGKLMLTDSARGRLEDFRDSAKRWQSMDPRQVARDYAEKSHEAVNERVFGVPIGTAVAKSRSLFDDRWTGPGSADHYRAVAASKGEATRKLTEEAVHDPKSTHVQLRDAIAAGRAPELIAAQKAVSGVGLSDAGAPADAGLSSLAKDLGAVGDKPVNLGEVKDFMPRFTALQQEHKQLHGGDALAGLDEFIKQRDPELWKHKQLVDYAKGRTIAGPGGSAAQYSAAIGAGLKTQDTLKTWGKRIGLAGAGVLGAGVLLTLLRNAIEERRRKREEEEDAG